MDATSGAHPSGLNQTASIEEQTTGAAVDLDMDMPFSRAEVNKFQKIWQLLQPTKVEIGLRVFCRLFYDNLDDMEKVEQFVKYCEVVRNNEYTKAEQILRANQEFHNHSVNFICVIEEIVQLLPVEPQQLHEKSAPFLRDVGRMHVRFRGFEARYLDMFGRSIQDEVIKQLRQELDKLTDVQMVERGLTDTLKNRQLQYEVIERAWTRLLAYIVRRMKEGAMRYNPEQSASTIKSIFSELRTRNIDKKP